MLINETAIFLRKTILIFGPLTRELLNNRPNYMKINFMSVRMFSLTISSIFETEESPNFEYLSQIAFIAESKVLTTTVLHLMHSKVLKNPSNDFHE